MFKICIEFKLISFYSFYSNIFYSELDDFLRLKYGNSINFIGFSDINRIVFISSSFLILNKFYTSLKQFFSLRKIFSFFSHFHFVSLYDGFNLFGWKFFLLKEDFFTLQLSYNNLRLHKLRLKSIIKLNLGSSIFYIVERLNQEIFFWIRNNFFSDLLVILYFKLDIFLYRILWNFLKRIHPRRPNTWIYNKYWKFSGGFSRFFIYDFLNGKLLFLKLHSLLPSISSFRFNFFFNIFEYFNQFRFYFLYSNVSVNVFDEVFVYLWKKQLGKCFFCNQFFDFSKQLKFKILNFNYNKNKDVFSKLVLIHLYCSFLNWYWMFII